MDNLRNFLKNLFGENTFKYLYLFRQHFHDLCRGIILGSKSEYRTGIKETINKINEYKGKDYIVFHNPTFMGVTSATRELFENLVPSHDIFRKSDSKKIANVILNNNIKKVYFSAFGYNWEYIIKYLKKYNKDIIIKIYWHASHSQILDTWGWERNQKFIELERKGLVDEIALCKESLINYYKSENIKTHFLNNTVNFDGNIYKTDTNNKEVRLGIYSANPEWRKNMMIHVASAKLIPNAVLDMVPINQEAKRFSELIGVKMDGLTNKVKREDLLARMAKNTVNLYVTFSECAPMLPIESLEVGVPCITGNNHHYFKNTELEKYLVVNNETDIEEVSDKIKLCIDNKDKILSLYKEWKKKNDLLTEEKIKEFIGDDHE